MIEIGEGVSSNLLLLHLTCLRKLRKDCTGCELLAISLAIVSNCPRTKSTRVSEHAGLPWQFMEYLVRLGQVPSSHCACIDDSMVNGSGGFGEADLRYAVL